MKNFLVTVVILCMLCMSGCTESTTNQTTEQSEETTEGEKVYITGEEIPNEDFGGNVYTYEYACHSDNFSFEGKVYILDLPKGLTNIEKEQIADSLFINEQDYVVIDYRGMSDPNMQIRCSYRADNPDIRKCVLDILLKYEENHPSRWERTYNSMNSEWYMHNMAYDVGYDIERSKHVDFNNNDEIKYSE
ncbi:MAG: hypothetical protein ACI3XA_02550 [Clostridia bacterium]